MRRLRSSARSAIAECTNVESAGIAATAEMLGSLLSVSAPLIRPVPEPPAQPIDAESLLRCRVGDYPALVADVIGPPLRVGADPWLGYVAAECALAALRQSQLQSAFSMVFLSTLCEPEGSDPLIEALDHILMMSDAAGGIGLFEQGARRTGTPVESVTQLRNRLRIMFATMAVQVQGTLGGTGPDG